MQAPSHISVSQYTIILHGIDGQHYNFVIIQKFKIVVLVLIQSPISAVFQIVRFPVNQKIALTGESL